jgi:uncharacterized surface protein with fasciclin (FAS1) repeats
MTKRFFATLRYTTVVALVASVFVFSGCGDDDKGPTVYDGTILDFLKSDQFKQSVNGNADISFDSLVMYLDKFPTLEANLTGTTDFTLFAPSNKAFVNLTALPGLKDPDQINQDIIAGVLQYHFVEGKKMQADMTAGSTIPTLYKGTSGTTAEVITINGDGTLLTGSQNNAIQITTADQLAKNGVVHTTGTVLIPPSTGSQLSAILGSLGATVLLGKDFTYMAYLITARADVGITNPLETFTYKISKGTDLTLLAIPNPVFVGAFNAANSLPATNVPTKEQVIAFINAGFSTGANGVARMVLNNHLITGKYTVAAGSGGVTQFTTGALSNTASGKTLNVQTGVSAANCSCTTGVMIAAAKTGGGTSYAPIVKADIDTEAGISNGVLQVVGGIILP